MARTGKRGWANCEKLMVGGVVAATLGFGALIGIVYDDITNSIWSQEDQDQALIDVLHRPNLYQRFGACATHLVSESEIFNQITSPPEGVDPAKISEAYVYAATIASLNHVSCTAEGNPHITLTVNDDTFWVDRAFILPTRKEAFYNYSS